MQRKKRSKRQREARNRKWSKRWQRSKYLPRKAPETATVSDAQTLTMDKIMAAMETVRAMPPVPFLASCALLPTVKAIAFKEGGRDYVGAHPSVWAQFPAGRGLPGFEAVTIWDLDAETLRDKRAEFFSAMRRVDDAAFIRWLDKLKDELRSTYGYTPPQVEQYVTAQPEAWREFFNDDYTPSDAAAEDQRAGAE